jgi:epoxyqueuosine reductase
MDTISSQAASATDAKPTAMPAPLVSPVQTASPLDAAALAACARRIRDWARELGFGAVGISDTDLLHAEAGLAAWLAAGYHGEMDYMAKHGSKRARPAELVPGTVRVISVRMPYIPAEAIGGSTGDAAHWRARELARLDRPAEAVVSVYARGRDYHKVMRQRLQKLADRIEAEIGPFGYRVFTDSAPVLEVELARKAGLGWRGKHTLLLQRQAGSLFFLGEIYVDVPLPVDLPGEADAADCSDRAGGLADPVRNAGERDEVEGATATASSVEAARDPAPSADGAYCGHCTRCIDACPTGAIVGPYRLDARRCISYLTIELQGSIPLELRPLIGNRVYGCDDCQLVCPWNKFAQRATSGDFDVRNGLDRASLIELFAWDAEQFDARLAGSAIRRIGHERWLRNLAVAMGNALRAPLAAALRMEIRAALRLRADDPSPLVREHVAWALEGGYEGEAEAAIPA